MDKLRRLGHLVAPNAKKASDGRDQFPSRAACILASMGGAVGLGNLLRYPSVAFANNGLQWFIPYLIALTFLAIPLLILEISIGIAYRGGCMIAYDHISKRTKGVGMAVVFTGYVVCTYYVPILSWIMIYFRNSFTSPLPWTGRGQEFYMQDVIANPDPIPGVVDGTTVVSYTQYPGMSLIGETVGWCAFSWFVVWLCMFKGVGLTGRVVYFTMGLPIIMCIILIGRGASLPNSGEGIKLYMGEWNGDQLGRGDIWQGACGQIFFSIGVGFGYFTSYSSYNASTNAVQDALIIAISNSLVEVLSAFSVFGVIGFLGLRPQDGVQLGTFTVGFLTYPLAIAEMQGANVWAVLFFFTLMLLGISSAFALLESLVTLIVDTDWGKKMPRWAVSTTVVIVSFLLSLMYCTEFGFYLLDSIDTWTNNLALLFVVWCEAVSSTTVYRFKDVTSQVGLISWLVYNACYFGGMIIGLGVAHSVSAEAGAGVGFGLFIFGLVVSVLLARSPDASGPRFWGKNTYLNRLWWLAFYSGVQLTRDLNVHVGAGRNWSIPSFWGAVVKYVSAPILAIVCAFAYPAFYARREDPLHIFGFAVAHIVMVMVGLGFVLPRWFDVFVPVARRGEGGINTIPNVTLTLLESEEAVQVESGLGDSTKS